MDTGDSQLKRIVSWNRFLLAVMIFLFLCGGMSIFIRASMESIQSVRAGWDGDTLRISSWVDGPVVVTHLVRYGDTEADKATAILPEPIAVVDSKGASLKSSEWNRLVWHSAITGEKVPPPPVGTHITALYFRALMTKWRDEGAKQD